MSGNGSCTGAGIGFLGRLGGEVGGYLIKLSTTMESIGLVWLDLISYVWVGHSGPAVVVVVFLQILPEGKRRQTSGHSMPMRQLSRRQEPVAR